MSGIISRTLAAVLASKPKRPDGDLYILKSIIHDICSSAAPSGASPTSSDCSRRADFGSTG
jgi:hypothetical protein